jgi:hypothetical protein
VIVIWAALGTNHAARSDASLADRGFAPDGIAAKRAGEAVR